MKRIPESYKSAPVNSYAREIAVCRCGGALSFSTNMNGYVLESCARCRTTQQMTRAPLREELDPMPTEAKARPVESVQCEDCPTVIVWEPGRGQRPDRCQVCRRVKIKADGREWARKRALKRKEAA